MLDDVYLSSWAVQHWVKTAIAQVEGKIDPRLIPDEDAEVLPNGDLRLFIDYEGTRIAQADIPPSHWRYVQCQ